MNRKGTIILISSASLGLLLGLTTLATLTWRNGSSELSVSFVNTEASNGEFPSYVPSERLAFAVRNASSRRLSLEVSQIEDEYGNWIPSLHILGGVEAGRSPHLYLYLPRGSHPRSVRMLVRTKASVVQKTQYAFRLLIDKAFGRYPGKQIWFDR